MLTGFRLPNNYALEACAGRSPGNSSLRPHSAGEPLGRNGFAMILSDFPLVAIWWCVDGWFGGTRLGKMFFVMDACRLAKNPCLTKQGLVAVQSKLRLAVNLLIATLI